MHVLCSLQLAYQRPVAAEMDRHVAPPGELDDAAGIVLGEAQRDVAGDGGDRQHLQLVRRGQRQQQGDGVVLTGIAVDDDRLGCHDESKKG